MKKVNKLISLSLSAVLLSSFCGCNEKRVVTEQKKQTVISFSWWGNDTRNEYTIKAVRKFEELHPDIKVNCSYSEWSGFEARNQVRMNSNTESDVMQINFNWLAEYSPDGTGYYDLEKQSNIIDFSTISDDYLNYGRKNGILNAIPIAMNTETIYINKTIYDKYGLDIPETWDDLFKASEVMKKDGVYPLAGAKKSIWLLLVAYAEQKSGKSFLDENGKLQFGVEEFQIMLNEYCDMVKSDVIPQFEYFVRTEIDDNNYAGAIGWVSDAVNYFSTSINEGNEIVIADYLNFDPKKSGDGWYAKPAQLYAISKNTEHPEESAVFIDFLVNSKEMALLQGVEKGIPLSSKAKKYMDEEGILSGIQYDASLLMDSNKKMSAMSSYIENAELIDAFSDAQNAVLFSKMDSRKASENIYKIAKKICNQ